ncbi:ATP-binding protein [Kitasatospora azatica]|uniref:ATP-binding protein n=1 Tax=Kitasatospora azatica TaxID=58347 RepID=UPI00068D8F9F|nr:ATP-binding protein [Kitasatospora azatica]
MDSRRKTEERLRVALAPADLAALSPLRAELRAALCRWGRAELADTAELLACELATNALRHTDAGAVLEAGLTAGGRLRVAVRDGDTRLRGQVRVGEGERVGAGVEPGALLETSGRGLLLVDALSENWGVRLGAEGKTTWFELGPGRTGSPGGGPGGDAGGWRDGEVGGAP